MTWLSFKGQIWQLWQKLEISFLNCKGLSATGFHCFLLVQLLAVSCPLASKGSCRPNDMIAPVETTQIQIQDLLRQMWGTIFFLHHPGDKEGKILSHFIN